MGLSQRYTVADVIADEYLDMGEDYDDADQYARRASKKMSAERRVPHPPTTKKTWKPTEGIRLKKSLRPGKLIVTEEVVTKEAPASTASPSLSREKSNIRDAVRNQIDSKFDWNQCLWGPFAVRFEASDSNKFYMVWVYDHNGAFRALGAYGGLGQSPRLQDILTTRDRGAAEKAAAKKLKAKERKGYFNYSAEYSNAIVQFEDGSGFSSASAPPNDIHFGADTDPDEYNPYGFIPGIDEDVLGAENQIFALTYWISEGINIEEITDLTEALELYLSLSDDINQMEDMELQKNPRYAEAKRLRSELSDKLDELQVPIIVQEEIEFDSESILRVNNILKGVAGTIVALFGFKMWSDRK